MKGYAREKGGREPRDAHLGHSKNFALGRHWKVQIGILPFLSDMELVLIYKNKVHPDSFKHN